MCVARPPSLFRAGTSHRNSQYFLRKRSLRRVCLRIRKANRWLARVPRGGGFWCWCDRSRLTRGKRCRTCGRRPGVRTIRVAEFRRCQ